MTVAVERSPDRSSAPESLACRSRISVDLPGRRAAVRPRAVRPRGSASTRVVKLGGLTAESSPPPSSRWQSRRTSASMAGAARSRSSPRRSSCIQGVVGLVADSAVVYLAQPVIVSAIWGLANLVSAAIGRPLMRRVRRCLVSVPRLRQGLADLPADLQLRVGRLGPVPDRAQRYPHARPVQREHRSLRRDPVRDRHSAGRRARALVALVRACEASSEARSGTTSRHRSRA